MAFAQVHPGDLIQSQNLNQVVNALNGTAGDGQPVLLVALNDPNNYALTVQNLDPTNCRALLVLKNDGTTLLSAGCNGVTLGSPLTLAAGAQIPNANLGPDVARANQLTNGGFEIWQRGNGPFTTNAVFGPDRWQLFVGASSSLSVSRDGSNQDAGSQYCAACTYTHAAASQLYSAIENFTPLRGQTVSLSIRVRANAANAARLFANDGVAASYSGYHSGNNAYSTLTLTITVSSTAIRLLMGVELDASCTAYLDNATLVVGSQPANYVPLHPADDLARCLRYYQTLAGTGYTYFLPGTAYSAGNAVFVWPLSGRMAVTPTLTTSAAATFANFSPTGTPVGPPTSIGAGSVTTATVQMNSTGGNGLTGGNGTMLLSNNASAFLIAEANP